MEVTCPMGGTGSCFSRLAAFSGGELLQAACEMD